MAKEEESPASVPPSSNSSSNVNLDPKVGGLLAYLLGWVSGLILYLISKDPYVRFHAMQSIILFAAVSIINIIFSFITFINILVMIINIGAFVLWIVLMVKAYSGEKFKLPIIGNIAEERA